MAVSRSWRVVRRRTASALEMRRAIIVFCFVVGAIVAAVLGFSYWLDSGFNRLNQSITGTPRIAISTSMEPYELIFRSRLRGGKRVADDNDPYEWILAVPRAYVIYENGSRSAIQDNESKGGSSYFASIHTVVDLTSLELTPATLAKETGSREGFLAIRIGNTGPPPQIATGHDCMPIDDYSKFIESQGGIKAPSNNLCKPPYANCAIYSHYHGWDVMLHATRTGPLFTEPQKACALMRSFLDKHTVRIDSLVPE